MRSYAIGEAIFPVPALECALYLVATPIGNLRDISLRALETLAGVDIVACEDTRVTRILLDAYAIKQKTVAYHEHNAQAAGERLMQALLTGKSVALMSDAGTPLVSDPGFDLVRQARQAGVPIMPLPGACALLAALVVSGLPAQSFLFDGFLPSRRAGRIERLTQLRPFEQTLIFYESPHRLAKTLADMADIFGGRRPACLCRELTKYFETVDAATLEILAQKYGSGSRSRGEIVLVVGGADAADAPSLTQDALDAMLMEAATAFSTARAAKEVASLTGEKKEHLYQRLLSLKYGSKDDGK